jgi:WD40 repeat protein
MLVNRLLRLFTVLTLLALAGPAAGQWMQGKVRPPAKNPSAAFSRDSRSLALLDGRGTLRVWDVAGKETKSIPLDLGPEECVEQVRYTPAGELTVLLSRYEGFKSGPGWFVQGNISTCLWNLTSGKRSPFVEIGYGGLARSPESGLLAYRDGLWELSSGKKLRKVPLPRGLVCAVEFAPDGKSVLYQISESLAQDFALLFLVDAATGKKLLQIGEIDLEKDRDKCNFFCEAKFSPDGRLLAFLQADESALHLREAAGGKALHRIPLPTSEQVVGFSPDSRTVFTWRGDSVRCWDTATGKEGRTVKVGEAVDSVLLSPDGKTVALLKGKAVEFRRLRD